jgi:hypothetical protein
LDLRQKGSEEPGGEEEMQDKTNNNANQIKAAGSTSNRKRNAEGDVEDVFDYDPLDNLEDYEMIEESQAAFCDIQRRQKLAFAKSPFQRQKLGFVSEPAQVRVPGDRRLLF